MVCPKQCTKEDPTIVTIHNARYIIREFFASKYYFILFMPPQINRESEGFGREGESILSTVLLSIVH